ncbi:MAG: hypothetical protein IT267_10755 [Saprospiraceae bacterium]|nr:hypothetical protein [Saprospiraceae bacterium]
MKFIFCIWVLLLLIVCTDQSSSPEKPSIELVGTSKTQMKQGMNFEDSIFITLSFKDGDGDLGWGSNDNRTDIFVKDKRTGLITDEFKIPDIPNSNGQEISGNLLLRLYTTCCLFPNNIPPCSTPTQFQEDTIRYIFYIKDRKGNESNKVETGDIILYCK